MKSKIFCFAFLTAFLISMGGAPSAIAGEDSSFKVNGYVQSWYVSDDSTVGPSAIENQFLVRRARLGIKGKSKVGLLPVNWKLLGEFNTGNNNVLDAFLNVNLHSLFQVQIGQFKHHFMEIGTASSKVKAIGLIYRPEITQNIHSGQTGSALRDIGVRLHGTQKGDTSFGYDLEVVNGDGANSSDSNDNKTIVAHLFAEMMGVRFNGAFFTGKDGTEGSALDEKGFSGGVRYKNGPIWLQFEYAAATYDQAGGAADVEPSGWYVQAAYKVLPELQAVVRYDIAELDDKTSNTSMSTVGIGANYKINKNATISLNYFIKDADSGYSERTLLGRSGRSTVTGNAVGNVIAAQVEYTY